LRLLIEILLNDVNTKHVESAVNNIKGGIPDDYRRKRT